MIDEKMASQAFVKRCDIDELREEHELDGRWELRRKFLVAHRKSFSRSRLQCLSNTYCNIVLTAVTENEPEQEEQEFAAPAPELVKKKKRKPKKKKIVAMFEKLEVENKSTSEESAEVTKPSKEKKKKKEPTKPPQPKVSYGPLVAKGPKVTYGPLVTGAISKN
ncbi:hypothetical protein B566_EDAN013590 [Ephemera danica]|nr:hypothetical protein B566_EDAN013590 [Ephemera danica]